MQRSALERQIYAQAIRQRARAMPTLRSDAPGKREVLVLLIMETKAAAKVKVLAYGKSYLVRLPIIPIKVLVKR